MDRLSGKKMMPWEAASILWRHEMSKTVDVRRMSMRYGCSAKSRSSGRCRVLVAWSLPSEVSRRKALLAWNAAWLCCTSLYQIVRTYDP